MADDKTTEQSQVTAEAEGQENAAPATDRRIPATSVAVMIFILLFAFLCTGVAVVTHMIDVKYAPEVIKGKDAADRVAYPLPGRLPNGVAARVNEVEIPESQITNFIMTMRSSLGLDDQEAWDAWMIENGHSTETIRNRIIMYFLNNEMIDQMADELGIQPTEADYQETRDNLYATPESTQAVVDALAREGRTLEDYESDIVTLTKKRLIGEVYNEGTTDTPEFAESVLASIKAEHPEYAEVTSLDEVDPTLVEKTSADFKELSDTQAFVNYLEDYIQRSEILYAQMPSDLPYQSNSDTYFMQLEFLNQVELMLKRQGIELDEDTSLYDSLMAKAGEGSQS